MKGNYNIVAPVYDRLSRLVFGNAIITAQTSSLHFIPANSTILIVGGGTGWILEELAALHPQGLKITYVDISKKMVSRSRRRNVGNNTISFTNQPIQNFTTDLKFDVVMTPFLLDNFSDQSVPAVFNRIHGFLTTRGLWLYTDFQVVKKQAFWQKPFLKIMYLFFKIACNIEAMDLPDTPSLFQKFAYAKVSSTSFFHSFIIAAVYRKDR